MPRRAPTPYAIGSLAVCWPGTLDALLVGRAPGRRVESPLSDGRTARATRKTKSGDKKASPTTLRAKKSTQIKGGAFNGFANFGDIKGESTDKDHKDWIMVTRLQQS